MSGFRTYLRAFFAGSLVLGGAAAVSAAGGTLAASPAAAASPSAWNAYVVSYATDAVIPVNTATDTVGTPIAAGSGPSAIAITPNATTAYVTDAGTTNTAPGFVTPIDLSTNTAGTTIAVGSGPDAIAITPNGQTAYVGNYNADTVTPISLVTDTAGTPISVGAAPTSITITPDGSTAYVGLAFDSGIEIDLATKSIETRGPGGFSSAITPNGATVFGTNPQANGVNVFTPATDSGTTVAALNDPEGVAITPDGSTAYVAYSPFTTNKASLLPIDTATDTPGTPITLGTGSAEGVAITPDGSAAFVTDPTDGTVVPVDLASATAGSPISLGSEGSNPVAIAITPAQGPVAHVHVTLLANQSVTFDASASTVAYGTIASYAWNFGDGTTETTTTPTVTHAYASLDPTPVASVTETSSAGTSATGVFTGQTASSNGGSQSTATVSVLSDPTTQQSDYPIVTAVTPDIGSTYAATPVAITVSVDAYYLGVTGSEIQVDVGGVAATNVTVTNNNEADYVLSLSATLPAQANGVDNVVVTLSAPGYGLVFGSSAATAADQFTYSASSPIVAVSCTSSHCEIPAVQYGSTTVSSTVSSNCSPCTYSGSVSEGVPATADSEGSCPDAMSYAQAEVEVNQVDVESSNGASLSVAIVNTFAELDLDSTTVCEDVQSISGGSAARSPGSDQDATSAPVLGRDILLKKCATKAVAPCVKSVVASGRRVKTTVILPVNESIKLVAGPQKETVKTISPRTGSPGSKVTITGTNLSQVSEVFIDGARAGRQLIGGVRTYFVSRTAAKLVVKLPSGAKTGRITLVGWSGDATPSSTFKVT
jgi:DNA-binding beta-propeller fold protein YncE